MRELSNTGVVSSLEVLSSSSLALIRKERVPHLAREVKYEMKRDGGRDLLFIDKIMKEYGRNAYTVPLLEDSPDPSFRN